MNVLFGFSHFEEALDFPIKSDSSNNTATTIEMKLVSANVLIFLVKKACVNDAFIMNKIWGRREHLGIIC